MFISSLSGGGAEKMMLNLADGLLAHGYPVDVVAARDMGEYHDRVPDGADFQTLDAPRELRSLPGLVRYLQTERPDYLVSTGTGINCIAVWATRFARTDTRSIIRIQTTLSQSFENKARASHHVLPWIVKATYPAAGTVVANSSGVAADVADLTRLDRDEVRVIHNPTVTDELFDLADEPVELPWDEVGGDLIVTAGRFVPVKDFGTLLRAFASYAASREARLIMLGQGELREELETLAVDLGIGDSVWFPGFVDNPYAYLRLADLFVLSSRWEGLPNTVIEALACGTQVVATDCPSGPAEILRNGEFGTLVPVSNSDALAEGMATELSTDRDAETLRERARDFSLDTITDEYVQLFD
jgi:glycosyltransferase involved in cell wall biosynthesis